MQARAAFSRTQQACLSRSGLSQRRSASFEACVYVPRVSNCRLCISLRLLHNTWHVCMDISPNRSWHTVCWKGMSHVLPTASTGWGTSRIGRSPKIKARLSLFIAFREWCDAAARGTWHILTNNLSHSIHNTRENTAGVERSAGNLFSLCNKSTLTSRYIKHISSSIPATGASRLPDGSQRLKATSKERKSPL